jgi:ubiquinone biosynthesis protein Coq4
MNFASNLRLVLTLYRQDARAHLGDIAVLKADSIGSDLPRALRSELDPVRGYQVAIDLEDLLELPAHTFGYAYAHWMKDKGLSSFVLTEVIDTAMRRRCAYAVRYATTHDMVHVLLDFDTSWAGEMGVLAFAKGQGHGWVVTLQIIMAWLIYPLRSRRPLAVWRAYRRGLRIGRKAPFLLGRRLEERFDCDLCELRAELGLLD